MSYTDAAGDVLRAADALAAAVAEGHVFESDRLTLQLVQVVAVWRAAGASLTSGEPAAPMPPVSNDHVMARIESTELRMERLERTIAQHNAVVAAMGRHHHYPDGKPYDPEQGWSET